MMELPVTRYAKSGDIHIAYQVTGSGPLDLVFVPGFISNLDVMWQDLRCAQFFERLSSFARLIRFDKRGTGLSDRAAGIATLEERMDDVRAVMDAVGSERAALLGYSEGGAMSMLFSATYPDRTTALVLYAALARLAWAPDVPWGRDAASVARRCREFEEKWGTGEIGAAWAPSMSGDRTFRNWVGTFERAAASPGAAVALLRMNLEIDVRQILPSIQVPTLVLHHIGDRLVPVENGRYLGKNIPGAKFVELAGEDHLPWYGDSDLTVDEIEHFLTGVRRGPDPGRVLATVLFTDIVDATKCAAKLGDRAWKELLTQHHSLVRQQLARHRGREIDTAGDGFLTSFDGPARAVRCGRAIADAVKNLGIRIRAGVHTGECEMMGDKLGGIAVHIGARIAALAKPDEVLVSRTVRDLVAGSGLQFEDHGTHTLKGVPGEWNLLTAI